MTSRSDSAPAPLRLASTPDAVSRAGGERVAGRLRAAGLDVEVVTAPDASAQGLGADYELLVADASTLADGVAAGGRVAAFTKRGELRDAVLLRAGSTLEGLAEGSIVGVASSLQAARLAQQHPVLAPTLRLGALSELLAAWDADDEGPGRLDALVAPAGEFEALGHPVAPASLLALSDHPVAPGQGSLAIVLPTGAGGGLARAVRALDHAPTRLLVEAELAISAALPPAARPLLATDALIDAELLLVSGRLYAPAGAADAPLTSSHGAVLEGPPAERTALAAELAARVAAELIEQQS